LIVMPRLTTLILAALLAYDRPALHALLSRPVIERTMR